MSDIANLEHQISEVETYINNLKRAIEDPETTRDEAARYRAAIVDHQDRIEFLRDEIRAIRSDPLTHESDRIANERIWGAGR